MRREVIVVLGIVGVGATAAYGAQRNCGAGLGCSVAGGGAGSSEESSSPPQATSVAAASRTAARVLAGLVEGMGRFLEKRRTDLAAKHRQDPSESRNAK
ncbi:hypothetical protein ABW38_20360 [Achromobacter xylosoxidans]|nr:hypothetical protein ABW34_11740 [Achromobacter xylosoxidans]KOQ32098.1 hypothetical protein ABW36_15905 [Achromobacter xylosoxidans]KOQ42456.1 hypothetical protein ABW38_20360 [Achromobacter xylosoxidans]KOQ45352.1 hypothetical protein ABW37_06540 [Achromobacter xylosoxidans]KOQ56781.1 hypothetical protein ABW40_16160 [Achromobacter xylosoxidans]